MKLVEVMEVGKVVTNVMWAWGLEGGGADQLDGAVPL